MWCVWGQMIVLGMVQWPTLNSHWAATATATVAERPHGIIIRQNNLHCELEQFFSLFFSRFYFAFRLFLAFIFVLFLAHKKNENV